MTINDFRGQVKVADVQAAFDEIVNRINSAITTYKSAQELEDIDYTKGSPKLGAAGYTLTVGGLKSILHAYEGCTIGAKAYKISDEESILSDGLHIRNGRPYRINAQIVKGGDEPPVHPEASEAYYSYSNLDSGRYYNRLLQVNNYPAEGYTYNNLSSVPFEFNKVYKIEAGSYYPQDGASGNLIREFKFGEYNANLTKVVPVATFDDRPQTPVISEIPHNASGEATTGDTVSIDQSVVGSIERFDNYPEEHYYVYIQKVRVDNEIRLYFRSYYHTYDVHGNLYIYSGRILGDSSGEDNTFTELMERCNYIIGCDRNSNQSISMDVPYYEISGTLDQITDFSELGEAHYYPDDRPSGTWGDASEIYYDLEEEELYPKTIIDGGGVTTEVVQAFTNSATSGEAESNNDYPTTITASSNSENAYLCTSETNAWTCDARTAGKSYVMLNSSLIFEIEGISLAASISGTSGTINIYLGDDLIHSEDIADGEAKEISLEVDNVQAVNIKIEIDRPLRVSNNATFSVNNLKITNKMQVYAFKTGDVITPNYNLIRLYKLNWDSGDIVLNSIEGVQLEGLENVYITTQNRKIQPKGYSDWDNINNSESGKFIAYTTGFHPYTGWRSHSTVTFEGIEIDGLGVHSNNPDRRHYRAQALSLIYIPKGFAVTDTHSGACGRYVYKYNLHK